MSLVATFDVDTNGAVTTSKSSRRLRHSIYLGGKADAKDYEKLVHRWKITHVLNCTPRKQTNIEAGVPNYFEKPKSSSQKRLKYHRIPIYDAPSSVQELQSEHEADIIRFITKGLCHGNVLVHCSRGVSRSTTSIILYLMAKRGYSYDDAIALIRRRRPQADPIPAFETWLKERDVFYQSQRRTTSTDSNDHSNKSAIINNAKGPQLPPAKKRKVQTPAGPSAIGPSLPQSTIGPSIGPSSIGPTPPPTSIGPALPPTESIGPELPPTKASYKTTATTIGPALPPTVATKPKKTPPKRSIGPALPP